MLLDAKLGGRSRCVRVAALLVAVAVLGACGKHGEPLPAATPAAVARAAGPWVGAALHGNDAAALRAYIESVAEVTPRTFKVQWSPATVAIDRAAALRSLRSVSADGAVIGLASSEPAVAKLKPGSILWVWDIAVRKVQSLEQRGEVTLVTTIPVALPEAMPNAEIDFETPPPLNSYYIARRAAAAAPAATGLRRPPAPHFLYARYDAGAAGEAPAGPGAPADSNAPPGNESPAADDWFDEGMSANGYTGSKGDWTYSLGYGTRPGGITLELQARKGDDVGGETESGVDPNAAKEKYAEIEKEHMETKEQIDKSEHDLNEEQQALRQVDTDYQGQMQQLPSTDKLARQRLQNEWDAKRNIEARKLASVEQILAESRVRLEKIEASKRALKAAKAVAKQLWDIVSDNVDARLRARMDLDGFTMGEHLVFRNGDVDLASTHFKNLNGSVHAQLIGRLGHEGSAQIKIPVIQVPIAFNVPIPVGGIPFVVQVGADFALTLSLTGAKATLSVDGQTAFSGDSGFDYSKSKASYSTEFKGQDPKISDYKGFSLGVSAVVLGIQIPRLGMGLGVLGVSSVAYMDVVNVITMTNGAAVGLGLGAPACKRITYNAVGHVGIDTTIVPLPFDISEKVEKSLSPKKEIFNRQKELLDPAVKMCEVT